MEEVQMMTVNEILKIASNTDARRIFIKIKDIYVMDENLGINLYVEEKKLVERFAKKIIEIFENSDEN